MDKQPGKSTSAKAKNSSSSAAADSSSSTSLNMKQFQIETAAKLGELKKEFSKLKIAIDKKSEAAGSSSDVEGTKNRKKAKKKSNSSSDVSSRDEAIIRKEKKKQNEDNKAKKKSNSSPDVSSRDEAIIRKEKKKQNEEKKAKKKENRAGLSVAEAGTVPQGKPIKPKPVKQPKPEASKKASKLFGSNESTSSSSQQIKKRGNRGSTKSECSAGSPLPPPSAPTASTHCDKLDFNAETFIILDLLSMPPENREKFLLEAAIDRKIIIQDVNSDKFVLNPTIEKYNHLILVTGEKRHRMNVSQWDGFNKLDAIGKICTEPKPLPLKVPIKSTTEQYATKFYEDIVNEVVLNGVPQEKIVEFTFPRASKKTRGISNYTDEEEFVQKLEKYAQKCVDNNLGIVVDGEIRINAKNNYQSFVTYQDGVRDAFIGTRLGRKFALHGDIVKVFIRVHSETTPNPVVNAILDEANSVVITSDSVDPNDTIVEESIKTNCLQAFVIKILKKEHNRKCVGTISSVRSEKQNYVLFVPRDMKMQQMKIYKENLPEGVLSGQLDNIGDVLYVAEIDNFINDICIGKITHTVGKFGELESENKAILLQNNLIIEPYEDKFNVMHSEPIEITNEDVKQRQDIRNECVFTIDPLTARDLDDAMSVRQLDDGCFEVGVHISDVTYFLAENSELDNIVRTRTTSVYLVNEVFHMLPKPLCYKCSLLPGEDKFAFSVFWKMSTDGEILDTRFTRTILNSCTQLAYEHAQKIIDNPDEKFTEVDFPQIYNGYSVNDIVSRVKTLYTLSEVLRKKRFENGALRINRPKLYFDLHPETGEPISYSLQQLDTANFLIEEFMLLANQSVADFIHTTFPDIAILRNHQPPLVNAIQNMQKKMTNCGIHIDITSSKTIYDSLLKLWDEKKSEGLEIALSNVVSKTMKRATYICSETITDTRDLWHYALSIPIYTHFTSPIRRYPDILVHRLLSAALNYTPRPARETSELHKIARLCNEMKYNAKIAGENSADLYFLHYVKSEKSIRLKGVIVDINKHTMEVILIKTGHTLNITYRKTNGYYVIHLVKSPYTAEVTFDLKSGQKTEPKNLHVFSEIDVVVTVQNRKLIGNVALPEGCIENVKTEEGKEIRIEGTASAVVGITNNQVEVQIGKDISNKKASKKANKLIKKMKSEQAAGSKESSDISIDPLLKKDKTEQKKENPIVVENISKSVALPNNKDIWKGKPSDGADKPVVGMETDYIPKDLITEIVPQLSDIITSRKENTTNVIEERKNVLLGNEDIPMENAEDIGITIKENDPSTSNKTESTLSNLESSYLPVDISDKMQVEEQKEQMLTCNPTLIETSAN